MTILDYCPYIKTLRIKSKGFYHPSCILLEDDKGNWTARAIRGGEGARVQVALFVVGIERCSPKGHEGIGDHAHWPNHAVT